MRLKNHRLIDDEGGSVSFRKSPNTGGELNPSYLIMHYTAGGSAQSAIDTLCDRSARASAHVVIGRDGAVTQLVPFNRVAWHAGPSRWHGLVGLNKHSIGIEMENAGSLTAHGDDWLSWFNRSYKAEDVMVAAHKHEDVDRGWHIYPEVQFDRVIEISRLLVQRYGLRDVLGHDDISPGRKSDPGPAFPLASVASAVLGRREDKPELFVTRTRLNIRSGPGIDFEKISETALNKGVRLELQARDCNWCYVDVLDEDDEPTLSGWVHGDYIEVVG